MRSPGRGTPRNLDTIPPELLDEIAFHIATSGHPKALGPPFLLIPLLLTNKEIHESLSSSVALYARIFRTQFDVAALERRFPPEWLTSQCLVGELKRRWASLKRMKRVATHWLRTIEEGSGMPDHVWDGYPAQDVTGDMWTSFLMLLESDGQNYEQLVVWASLRSYVDAYIAQFMFPRARQIGFQSDSVNSSLALWLSWFTTTQETLSEETSAQLYQQAGLLRPFVFGAHKYDPFLAPWSFFDLPLPTQDGKIPTLPPRFQEIHQDAYMAADLYPRDNQQLVHYLHRQLVISCPIICHASIMSFFLRIQKGVGSVGGNELVILGSGGGGPHHAPLHPAAPIPGPSNTQGIGGGTTTMAILRLESNHGSSHHAVTNNSKVYDIDFNRLTACLNPYIDSFPTERVLYVPGALHGVWEGRFAYFDFDAYQDMLVGHPPPVVVNHHDLTLGQQPQVWRINEYHLYASSSSYKPRVRSTSISSPNPAVTPNDLQTPSGHVLPLPTGPALNAHIPEGARFEEVSDGLEVYLEGSKDCLFYKKYSPKNTRDGQPSSDKYAKTPDTDEQELVLDTLYTGTGHSAWGPFVLRGRLRPWDGLIALLKDYSGPQGRGQWLYRGYIHGGTNWVGRWRDTITETRYTGYEGAFGMRARR